MEAVNESQTAFIIHTGVLPSPLVDINFLELDSYSVKEEAVQCLKLLNPQRIVAYGAVLQSLGVNLSFGLPLGLR